MVGPVSRVVHGSLYPYTAPLLPLCYLATHNHPCRTGAHILSGNVFQPKALDELIPSWREDASCPIHAVPAVKDRFYYLTPRRALRMPTPPQMHNKGNYVISLSEAVRWLGAQAEEAGVEIYPGFAGSHLLTSASGACVGVGTGDMGIGKDGTRKDSFAPGLDLRARVTLLAEGCRGSLTKVCGRRRPIVCLLLLGSVSAGLGQDCSRCAWDRARPGRGAACRVLQPRRCSLSYGPIPLERRYHPPCLSHTRAGGTEAIQPEGEGRC